MPWNEPGRGSGGGGGDRDPWKGGNGQQMVNSRRISMKFLPMFKSA